jgi:hypothetical protein
MIEPEFPLARNILYSKYMHTKRPGDLRLGLRFTDMNLRPTLENQQ